MFPLGEFYPVIVTNDAELPEIQEKIVRYAWEHCMEDRIRKAVEPLQFSHGILKLQVQDETWQHTISSKKSEIIRRMNKYLRKNLLSDLVISSDLH